MTGYNTKMNQQLPIITYTSFHEKQKTELLAGEHSLRILSPEETPCTPYLIQTSHYLGIMIAPNQKKPIYIDFLTPQWQYRLHQSRLRKEHLAKVISLAPSMRPSIIDATAGLGRDGFILAALGYDMTLLERSMMVYLLLHDALNRAKEHDHLNPIVKRINLIHADALAYLAPLKPDIIYLDPMFPEKKKAAASKKEIMLLKLLLGKNDDTDKLFALALACATKRIVVKRPRLGEFLSQASPNFSLMGNSSRFDIYLKI